MENSGTPIQPSRSGSEGRAPQGAFQGTVTAVKQENGSQTVEIASSQGRIKLQAEGEFHVGEKLRVFMPQGGAVRLEKMAQAAGKGDWQAVGYQLPGNLDTLKGVRIFEEQLANWVGSRQLGGGAGKGGLAQALGGSDQASLLRLPLPELLKRVLAREGGREMLMQALSTLGKDAFASLLESLEEGSGDSAKSSLAAMLRNMRRDFENGATLPGAPGKGTEGAGQRGQSPDLGAFWPGGQGRPGAGAGGEAAPWMGRVLERNDPGASLAFAGGRPLPQRGAGGDPMSRYLLDLGGRTLEVHSAQSRQVGEFVDFEMESGGARLQARFLDPAAALPASLKEAHAAGSPEQKAALQVAARFLSEFKGEPYFDRLVKDFGEVLAQGGRLALPDGSRPAAGQMPTQKELDGLLRLFVAFPRDTEKPEQQSKTWSQALKDPKAMADLLRSMQPDKETSLLRSGTPMRAAGLPGAPGPDLAGFPTGTAGAGSKEDALVALLRRLLPEGFKPAELAELAKQAAPGGDPKDAKQAQFLMQAFAGLVPREEELREGRPNQFFFYHNQDWKGLQVTWERDRGPEGRAKRDPDAPVKVRVETESQHMGKVDVGVVVRKDQATLDFRNQFHDVRELLAEHMPELEKAVAALGVRIEGWTYQQMQDTPHVLPTAGWVRPASLDGGNLDLMG